MGCNKFQDEDMDKMIADARAGKNSGIESCGLEFVAEMEKEVLPRARETFKRALEEMDREDMAKKQVARDEQSSEYRSKLQQTAEIHVSDEHAVLLKGFDASRINNGDTARVQALFPPIVNQVTQQIEYTGKLPETVMDRSGSIWATVEHWNAEEGRAVFIVHRHSAELIFGKSESELTKKEKEQLPQKQMDTQLHANFHTIHNILFTDEDRMEVERICEEMSESKPGWEEAVSEYAERKAREGRNDEVFCECGVKFMTNPKDLQKANENMFNFIKDKLERLSDFSELLGIKNQITQP